MRKLIEKLLVWARLTNFGRCGLCNKLCDKSYAEIKYRVASYDEEDSIETMRICTNCTDGLEKRIYYEDRKTT
jgi:hypothetical protein